MFKTASPYVDYLFHFGVEWLPFSEKTIKKASDEDKLIFIHIGQIGNVYDRISVSSLFSDQDVVSILNNEFISIPIDEEDYPEAYLLGWDILQMNNEEKGNSINIFMMPDFTPITCTSSCDPDDFLLLSDNLLTAFREKRRALTGMAEEAKYILQRSGVVKEEKTHIPIDINLFREYTDGWSMKFSSFDNYFKSKPFYVKPPALTFLLSYLEIDKQLIIKDFIFKVCDRVIDSPMQDPLDGGFFFQMEDCTCKKPLFEKRLSDNLLVALFYARAYLYSGNERYRTAAERSISFVKNHLKDPSEGYINCITLDEEPESITYYMFSISEIIAAFPDKWESIATAFEMNLSVSKDEKQTLSNSPLSENLPQEYIDRLIAIRKKRSGIIKDSRKITSCNSLLINVLCILSDILGKPEFVREAMEIHQYMMTYFHNAKGMLPRYISQEQASSIEGNLLDYAEFIGAGLSLYQSTKDDYYLRQAQEYMDFAIENFYNDANGMFFKSSKYSALIPIKRESNIDGNIGSTNSIICNDLLKLYETTGNRKYIQLASRQLDNVAPHLHDTGPYMANWASQLLYFMKLPYKE